MHGRKNMHGGESEWRGPSAYANDFPHISWLLLPSAASSSSPLFSTSLSSVLCLHKTSSSRFAMYDERRAIAALCSACSNIVSIVGGRRARTTGRAADGRCYVGLSSIPHLSIELEHAMMWWCQKVPNPTISTISSCFQSSSL